MPALAIPNNTLDDINPDLDEVFIFLILKYKLLSINQQGRIKKRRDFH
jgi:hypothetical protein